MEAVEVAPARTDPGRREARGSGEAPGCGAGAPGDPRHFRGVGAGDVRQQVEGRVLNERTVAC